MCLRSSRSSRREAAAQNILVAAHALGFGGFWRTGNAAYDNEVKAALGLQPGRRHRRISLSGHASGTCGAAAVRSRRARYTLDRPTRSWCRALSATTVPSYRPTAARTLRTDNTQTSAHEHSHRRSFAGRLLRDRRVGRRAGPARPLAPVRVISFDGGWNLPVWAAQRQGFFEANGVAVQTQPTRRAPAS